MVRPLRIWAFAALLTITAPSVVAAQSNPTNQHPANGQTRVSPSPTLEIDCAPTGRTAAKYEISADPAFSSLAYATPENINDLCSHVAATNLNSLVTYYWRAAVRNTQGIWSPWSTPTTFTTIDAATVFTNLFQDGTLAYSGTRDADIRGLFQSPGQTPPREWNQGRQDVLRTGRRPAQIDETFRSLLKFDLAPHLSNPQAVVNAYIELTGWEHSDPAFFTAPNTLYEVYRPWGEGRGLVEEAPQPGEVSWTYSSFPDKWAIRGAGSASDTDPNADRAATRLVTVAPTNQVGFVTRWSSQELVEAVKRWIAQPESNEGVLLRADDESAGRLLHIASREHWDPSFRPLLVIESTERAARPPAPQDDVASTVEGMPVDIGVLLNDIDPEPGPQALAITGIGTPPTHGVTQLVGTLVRYTPGPGFVGTDSFTYTVSDGARSGTATVTVEVGSTGDGVRVWLEAETGTLTLPMAIIQDNASGPSWGKYIVVPNGEGNVSDGSSPGGQATYTFSVPAGTYAVWGRVSAPTSADNTFWVSMDGAQFSSWTLPVSTAWTWVRVNDSADPLLFSWAAAGPHTLVIKQSEDGARLDRLLITSNLAFEPETIVDNAAVGVRDDQRMFTGTWCVSTASGFFGNNSLYSCGGSGDRYQWIPNLPSAGSYDVYAWWAAHANRSTSVPITVFYAGGATTLTVNQRINGGTWRLLGRFPFNTGTGGYVEVSAAGGQAAADAVRWVRTPSAPPDTASPNTTITGGPTGTLAASTATMTWSGVDDMTTAPNLVYAYRLDPLEPSFSAFGAATTRSYAQLANGPYTFHVKARDQAGNEDASPATRSFTVSVAAGEIVLDGAPIGVQDAARTFTGTWCTSTSSSSFGSESLYSCGSGIDRYRWTPTIPTAGTYQVYVWWTAHANRSTNVPITVVHAGGSATQTFNQRLNGGRWISLGTYFFDAGSGGYVEVTDANGQAAADAVRWVPAVTDSTAPQTSITGGPSEEITTSSATMTWTGTDNATATADLQYAYRLHPLESNFSAFGAATSRSYADLANGTYTFHVKARDQAGNEDQSPDTRTFTVSAPEGEIILDNAAVGVQDASRTFTGVWCNSSSAGFFGSGSLYNCGSSADRYRWTPNLVNAGSYEVYIWWTAHPNRSTSVPITVAHANGSTTRQVNQRINGGQWVALGAFTFNGSIDEYVEVSSANGQVAADAVRWVPASGAILLDNAAVGVQDGARAFSGTWCASTSSGSFGPNSLYSCGGGLDTYRWAADIPTSGNYIVSAWWTSHPNRSTTVDLTIVHANGSTTRTVNQRIDGGQWVPLGTFFFNAGTAAGSVEVNDANGQAAADAARWVPTSP